MLEDHAKILAVLSSAGEVAGRKKLQKIIYIAKKLNYPFHEKFLFHHYGLYSEELILRIEELCNLGFVHERKETINGQHRYCYSLTKDGERFLKHSRLNMPGIDECLASLNNQDERFLELTAMVVHFDHLEKEEVIQMVTRLKPEFTESEIKMGFPYFEELKNIGKDPVSARDLL
ncbi:MAG TPA: YwgA family protein [Bacillales bacterium]|nr:YwgA family protein [Bacillales bacterium]